MPCAFRTTLVALPTLAGSLFLLLSCQSDEAVVPVPVTTDSSIDNNTDSATKDAHGETDSSLGTEASDVVSDTPSALDTLLDVPQEASAPCTTKIFYGSSWIHPDSHPDSWDLVEGEISWEGACTNDGDNAFAVLSNGWKPYFEGHGHCVIAFEYDHCPGAPSSCSTRITYGPAWKPAPNHPNSYDDVAGGVLWDGECTTESGGSYATLSNGWVPHFTGSNACDLSFRYSHCGGLYANPVFAADCADPGVILEAGEYTVACTSGNAANAFPLRTSKDLVHWSDQGHIFLSNAKPSWASGDFWAPEIHRVGNTFVAYYTARKNGGQLSIGAATASSPLGPYTDLGTPLLEDPSMGLIDATEFEAPDHKRYLIWKEDGNAQGKKTPIHGQELSADGLSLVGNRVTLITNDQGWEGALVEGPWMIENGGSYYLFYSGNGYASNAYAIGVARASSPLGPFSKAPAPVVASKGPWAGPGHNSVVQGPQGQLWLVYHSWRAGQIGGGDGRVLLVDQVLWADGWPALPQAPSSRSLPAP